jgi:hypothetical protein
MASKTIVMLEDDLDGGGATESISFAFEGKSYTIDLNDKNAAKFRKAIDPFVSAARRESSNTRTNSRAQTAKRTDVADIRAWAREQGYTVSQRGRIAKEIQEAYDAA